MDDIAKQAGVSRPALYQLFKNKTDIFRALSQQLLLNAMIFSKSLFHRPQNHHLLMKAGSHLKIQESEQKENLLAWSQTSI